MIKNQSLLQINPETSCDWIKISEQHRPYINILWCDMIQPPVFPKEYIITPLPTLLFTSGISFTDKKLFKVFIPCSGFTQLLCHVVPTTVTRAKKDLSPTTVSSSWYTDIMKELNDWCVEFKSRNNFEYLFIYHIMEQRQSLQGFVRNTVTYNVICAGIRRG